MLNLIIFGAPGSGKGTQSSLIEKKYNLFHISTGDLLRAEIKNNTALGEKAQSYISNGQLVPDSLIIDLLRNTLEHAQGYEGVIFDGYPRTTIQAEALTELLQSRNEAIDLLIDLNVPEEELISRLLERGKVSGRSDDNEVAIRERLKVYHNQTVPVIDYYKKQDKYLPVMGTGDIQVIAERIFEGVEKKINS